MCPEKLWSVSDQLITSPDGRHGQQVRVYVESFMTTFRNFSPDSPGQLYCWLLRWVKWLVVRVGMTEEEIWKALKKVRKNKALGIDCLPYKVTLVCSLAGNSLKPLRNIILGVCREWSFTMIWQMGCFIWQRDVSLHISLDSWDEISHYWWDIARLADDLEWTLGRQKGFCSGIGYLARMHLVYWNRSLLSTPFFTVFAHCANLLKDTWYTCCMDNSLSWILILFVAVLASHDANGDMVDKDE